MKRCALLVLIFLIDRMPSLETGNWVLDICLSAPCVETVNLKCNRKVAVTPERPYRAGRPEPDFAPDTGVRFPCGPLCLLKPAGGIA